MVSKRGIEVNLDKIKAILDMEPPRSIKDVQKLTGRVVALGQFISKSGDKCLPFFKALKKVKDFEWTDEIQEAFKDLKKYMVQAPLLAKPILGETLKFRPYIQAHKIEVLTNHPLRNIIHSPKASGRMIKWAIELEEFDIKCKPRTAIKSQALADFVVECTVPNQEVGGQEDTIPNGMERKEKNEGEQIKDKEFRDLYFDGASKTNSSGARLVLQSPDGFFIEYVMKLDFPTTNNEAEYKALIGGLGLAGTSRVRNLKVCGIRSS
ncbi:uncharacterized protein LOC141718913 [Apium graveolens]|uniref:uncharacterized protein LOC141718913 n=1 Tax=Apium graveolens TaxID=4045 RepID=UPI003D7C0665